MPETWPISEENKLGGTVTIRQKATFDLKQLYKQLDNFAKDNNYFFNEKNFTRKDGSAGSEYQIEWTFERKVTPFIKFYIDVEIWSLRTREVKEKDKILYEGDLEINIESRMEMDWQKKWEKNDFTKFLRKVYIYYIKKQYFLNYAGKMWEETYDLHARLKTVLHQFSLPV